METANAGGTPIEPADGTTLQEMAEKVKELVRKFLKWKIRKRWMLLVNLLRMRLNRSLEGLKRSCRQNLTACESNYAWSFGCGRHQV